MFETGTNQWRRHDVWPPRVRTPRRLVLGAGGALSLQGASTAQPARSSAGAEDGGYDEYISDPARPVPFLPDTALGMPDDYMTRDQRFAARRADVLVYETEPLTSDVTIAGPIGVELWVSTSGTDSDFVVKLIDVYPADYPDPDPDDDLPMGDFQQLVRGEPFRAKFRDELHRAEADDARRADAPALDHARRRARLPRRPSHRGAGAELVVPAGRPQPADLHRHSAREAGGLPSGDAARLPRARQELGARAARPRQSDVIHLPPR